MAEFKFLHPMDVRYGDLDPQGHLNNAKYLTYFEQARVEYFVELGLFSRDQSFMDIGAIIADIHIRYEAPVFWGAPVKVGARASRIGGKSITLEQAVLDNAGQKVFAKGTVIMVTYDYHAHKSIAVPDDWRRRIAEYEGMKLNVAAKG